MFILLIKKIITEGVVIDKDNNKDKKEKCHIIKINETGKSINVVDLNHIKKDKVKEKRRRS